MASNLEKQIKPLLDTSLPIKAIVLGSGLAEITASFEVRKRIAYKQLAGFPQPRVGGHGGELLLCSTASCNLLVLRRARALLRARRYQSYAASNCCAASAGLRAATAH